MKIAFGCNYSSILSNTDFNYSANIDFKKRFAIGSAIVLKIPIEMCEPVYWIKRIRCSITLCSSKSPKLMLSCYWLTSSLTSFFLGPSKTEKNLSNWHSINAQAKNFPFIFELIEMLFCAKQFCIRKRPLIRKSDILNSGKSILSNYTFLFLLHTQKKKKTS